MKRILPIIQVGLGVLALVVFVMVLNALFQSRITQTGARQTPTSIASAATRKATREGKPTPRPTKKPKVDWADATLEQVKFGKAKTILSQDGLIKIWSWLPDNRRLLLELMDTKAKEITDTYRIVTLDIKTGEIVEYGRRGDEGTPPVWIQETQSIAFTWDTFPGGESELRLGQAGSHVQTIAKGEVGLTLQPLTGNIYYLLENAKPNALRLAQAGQPELAPQIPFSGIELPWGIPQIDPQGQYLAIIGRPDLQVLELTSGALQKFSIQEESPLSVTSGVWSPYEHKMAITLGTNDSMGFQAFNHLATFELANHQFVNLKLPVQWVHEYEWSPKGRFLFAKGGDIETGERYPNTFWLVDIQNKSFKEIKYFPKSRSSSATWMAWSSNGKLAWLKTTNGTLGIAITKVNPGR